MLWFSLLTETKLHCCPAGGWICPVKCVVEPAEVESDQPAEGPPCIKLPANVHQICFGASDGAAPASFISVGMAIWPLTADTRLTIIQLHILGFLS